MYFPVLCLQCIAGLGKRSLRSFMFFAKERYILYVLLQIANAGVCMSWPSYCGTKMGRGGGEGRGGGLVITWLQFQTDYSFNLTTVSTLLQFQPYYSFNLTTVSTWLKFQPDYSFNLNIV